MKLPLFADAFDEDHTLKRSMLAAACAVGVVSTFGTPIGGVLFSVEVTSTYFLVGNLWKCFYGAICAVVMFQLMADNELVTDVPSSIKYSTRLEPKAHGPTPPPPHPAPPPPLQVPPLEPARRLGVWRLRVGRCDAGRASACIVHAMAAAARAPPAATRSSSRRARRAAARPPEAGGLSFYRRRFATGLLVCLACSMASYTFPPMRVPSTSSGRALHAGALEHDARQRHVLGRQLGDVQRDEPRHVGRVRRREGEPDGAGDRLGSDIVTHAVAPITFDGGAITGG